LVKEKTIISLVGPTAVGKTALSIGLANALHTEIVSCDSRQFYKEISIGTAKPSPEELTQAKHHFINSHSIHDTFTSGDFEKEGLKLLDKLFSKYDTVILTGGSGLFEKALVEGFDQFPPVKEGLREELNLQFENQGLSSLLEDLEKLDPETYQIVEKTNHRRVIRSLEINKTEGKPLSYYKSKKAPRTFKTIRIGLTMDREKLYNRINQRVDNMMQEGLLDEVKSLVDFQHLNTLQTVGYSELFKHLNGDVSLEDAIGSIKQNTRRYAKRQLTWFRKYDNLIWLEDANLEDLIQFIS